MWWFEKILLWNLMAAVTVLGQSRPNIKLNSHSSSGLKSDCIGNLMRLSLDEALAVGNQLEVEAINGTQNIMLTPSLAAQCGYSMESDPWGNTRIYTSLLGCYVDNRGDATFNVGLKLRMYRHGPSDVVSRDVAQTCRYTQWASKEILCDRNYMEVSKYVATTNSKAEPKGKTQEVKGNGAKLDAFPGDDAEQGIWKMTFYTPEPVPMLLREAEQAGYSAKTTSTRLVLRSPYDTAETYSEDVAGIPMEVIKVHIYNREKDGMNVVDLAAACPTGGVLFTEDVISWHVPRRVTPLMDSSAAITEMYLGINGQRLDKSQMASRGYTITVTDFHIVAEIPVGSPDGYYKSHAPDYQYHITYTVEPMLEVVWRDGDTQEETKYKILFPITTPLMPRPPHAEKDTDVESRLFNIHLGPFLPDVQLNNITFSTGVLTIEEIRAQGFLVQEHHYPNGSKAISLQVPFGADVVLKHNPDPLNTIYSLTVVFGFIILPEETSFAHQVDVQASLRDVVMPTITGTCDHEHFYLSVKYGSQGTNIRTLLGSHEVTPELAEEFKFDENGTNFFLDVPYTAPQSDFETFTSTSVKARLDIQLWDPKNNWQLEEAFLICFFPLRTTTCYPNGTISALAMKVETAPSLDLRLLTLNDKSCKPVSSDDRFAQFSFAADSCGTKRTFFDNYMLYENEIALRHDHHRAPRRTPAEPEYRQKISCYYLVNKTETLAFGYKPQTHDPKAEIGVGQLMVQMRLAHDSSFKTFYQAEDYPVTKYLRQPLYFEVALMQSADPQLELFLQNCWATLQEDRTSVPSWDLIVDTCENREDSSVTIFHSVLIDARVEVPAHIKRFSMKMFAFIKEDKVLKDQIYVHCDAVICDRNGPAEGVCRGQCVNETGRKNPKYFGEKGNKRRE
ncbi:uncharacterized protein LOC115402311 [Salarias fasciatus]|uniref:uncharacterized protein LOC115402311 n=1 Tax=Salarias fasciatus TaxID=181472 RepID=UPI001176AF57|nr:uncharacterized protein LOC115402311 [Salarias fasciatus]